MDTYLYELKIPKDRVAVLIGKSGEIKNKLEAATETKISVDSKEAEVAVQSSDPLKLFTAREIIKAIGRGFNPDIALLLLKQDYVFEIINLNDFVKSKSDFLRLKGRVIGSEGKARKLIEDYSETYISVYGKTIAIIGEPVNVSNARKAVESLLTGSPHSNVYRWLEKRRRELKLQSI